MAALVAGLFFLGISVGVVGGVAAASTGAPGTTLQLEPDGNISGINNSSNTSPSGPQSPTGGGLNASGLNTTNSTNGTTNGTGNSSDGILGGAMGAVGSAVPSPGDWVGGIIKWAYQELKDGIAGFINRFNQFFMGVPAPGDPLDPMSWYTPDDPVWETVMDMYWTLVALSAPLTVFSLMQAGSLEDRTRRDQMLKEQATTVFMWMAGPFIIGVATHTANAVVDGFVPSGSEFLAAPASIAQLGVGLLLGAVIAKSNVIVLIIGIGIVVLIASIIYFSAAMWPIAWAARSSGIPVFRSMGNLVLTSFGLLLVLRAMQAILLRLLFEMPLGELGGGELVVYVLLLTVGLYYILYRLPRETVEKTFAASAITLGMSHLPKNFSAGDAARATKSKYENTRNRASATRDRIGRRLPTQSATRADGGAGTTSPGTTTRSNERRGRAPVTRSPANTSTKTASNRNSPDAVSRQRHMTRARDLPSWK